MSMAPRSTHAAHVIMNPQHQTREQVTEIVASMLGKAGCLACGRLAFLAMEFAGDPGPDMAKIGVISVNTGEIG